MSLRAAIELALMNPIRKKGRNSISRFGAILTNGKEYYIGWNQYKSHPIAKFFSQEEEKILLHAELAVLRQFWNTSYKDLSRFKLFTARVLKDGTPALAAPCPACRGAIEYFGIKEKNIEYTK